jgi:hypothetical protein
LRDFDVFEHGGPEVRRRFEQSWLAANKNASSETRPASRED